MLNGSHLHRSSSGTVEGLLCQIEAIPESLVINSTDSFDLWVPRTLSMGGNPVSQKEAMPLLLKALLSIGYFPDGSTRYNYGSLYAFERYRKT